MAVAPPAPERVGQNRPGGLGAQQKSHIRHRAPGFHRLQDVERQRHHHHPPQPLGLDEQTEMTVAAKHLDATPKEFGESFFAFLRRKRRRGLSGGNEAKARHQKHDRAQPHQGGITGGEGHGVEEPVRHRRDAKRQKPAAEEADRQQAASPRRGNRTRDDVVVGHGDNAADEGIDRPQNEEQDGHGGAGKPPGQGQQHRDGGQTGGPAEGADLVEWHAAGAALGQEGDEKLGEQPAVAEDRRRPADGEGTAGQAMDQGGDDGARIHRRRAALKEDAGGGEARKRLFPAGRRIGHSAPSRPGGRPPADGPGGSGLPAPP